MSWTNFTKEVGGKTYPAAYCVHRGMITVRVGDKQKTTQLGDTPVMVMAGFLASELIRGV